MSETDLESVFLRIGTDSRLQDHASQNLHRRILGNKGIGRLAMMRLGNRARVISWTKPDDAHEINFDWQLFEDASKQIDDIQIRVLPTSQPRSAPSGTLIYISALKFPWEERLVIDKVVGQFIRRLRDPFTVLSKPKESLDNISTESTEQKNTLTKEDSKTQNIQSNNFPIDIYFNSGNRIPIASMKKVLTNHLQYDFELKFNPDGVEDATDKSVILRTELIDYHRGAVLIPTQRTIQDVKHKVQASEVDFKSIGPFSAKLRWFNRDRLRNETTLEGTWTEARQELNLWSGGIAIYRDGFRIGFTGQSTGEDWLGLDSSALRRSGFTVNRIQVVGALRISRKDNPKLIDRSNREGLIESREATLVRQILLDFAIDELRRYIEHEGREEKRERLEELTESTPATIRDRVTQAEQGLMAIRGKVPPEVDSIVQSIAAHLHFIRSEIRLFEEASKQAIGRREDILELAGVGTVMSGVLHELARTTGHTRQLLQNLSKGESPKTKALLDKLDGEIKAINTRLRQLDPLTPSGRHRKQQFDLIFLLQTIINGYDARFIRHQVNCELHVRGDRNAPMMVNMVRGFVSLAIENLMANSIYWLQEGLKAGETQRSIWIEVDPTSRTLTFRDNGPGISPGDKQRVFTAGFTLRPRGQGLGLFLAAEIATYHNAKLTLNSVDDDGRYRSFVIQLPED